LHPTNERGDDYVVVAVIHWSHLTLKVTDVLLDAFSRLHFDGKEVVVVPLEFPSGSILVVESPLYLFKVLERLTRE